MRILLSGNRGYLGSVLLDLLIDDGHEVVGLDTGFYDAAPLQPRRDVRDVMLNDLIGVDAVVNLAALCNDACGELSEASTQHINADATARLASLARLAGVRTYVFASSCSVYGAALGGRGPLTEDDPVAPETAYAWSKVQAERAVTELAGPGFAPVALRFATLFGDSPSFRSDIMVNRIVGSALRWGAIRMNGDGSLERPLLHVRDAARAIVEILTAPAGSTAGQVFNVGFTDQNHSVGEVVETAVEMLPGITVTQEKLADNRSYEVSFRRFHSTFPAFRSTGTLRQGMAEVASVYENRLRLPLEAAGSGWAGTDRRERLLAMLSRDLLTDDFRWNAESLVVA